VNSHDELVTAALVRLEGHLAGCRVIQRGSQAPQVRGRVKLARLTWLYERCTEDVRVLQYQQDFTSIELCHKVTNTHPCQTFYVDNVADQTRQQYNSEYDKMIR